MGLPAALLAGATAFKAFGSIVQGFQGSANANAQAQAAEQNAAADQAFGRAAVNSAAARAGQQSRQGAVELGNQVAAIGQAGVGIQSASAQDVIRQSEVNQRMDFLNTMYGGRLQKYGYGVQAEQQQYQAKVAKMNAQQQLYGGFLGAGTSLLTGAANYKSGSLGATAPTL